MNAQLTEAHLAVQKAREALRNENRTEARKWAERAAALAPQMEDPWLVLAAVASPRASLEYIQRALKINPDSTRARLGMEWAMQRLRESPETGTSSTQRTPATGPERGEFEPKGAARKSRSPIYPILLFGLGCVVCAAAAWSASTSPALASILKPPAFEPTRSAESQQHWAQAPIPKPTYAGAALPTQMALEQPTATSESPATTLPTDAPTEPPAELPTQAPTAAPLATPPVPYPPTSDPTLSGSLSLEFVPDPPTSAVPTAAPAATSAPSSPGYVSNGGEHWIDVNLTQQMVYAYEGDTVMNSFLVSTGTWLHPTVTGQYHIYVKLRYTDMSGPDYYLPNVPYTMYFYQGYGLHGTYWHHNFGTPMSHGCVNLSIPDAEWLYSFASVGTPVNVHY